MLVFFIPLRPRALFYVGEKMFNKKKEPVEDQPQINSDPKDLKILELEKEVDYWKEAYNAMSLNHTHEMQEKAMKAMAFEEVLKIVDTSKLSYAFYELFNYKRNPLWLKEHEEELRKRHAAQDKE